MRNLHKRIIALFLAGTLMSSPVLADDDMVVMTAPVGTIDPETTMLDRSVRSVSSDIITAWAKDEGLVGGDVLEQGCTWRDFFYYLWNKDGAPDFAGNTEENIVRWVVSKGIATEAAIRNQYYSQMRHGDAQWALWMLSGQPSPTLNHRLPIGQHDPYEYWACDVGLIVREEQPTSNPSSMLTRMQALTYIYYMYHRRAENSFPITVDEFLASCQHVVDTARMYGYVYGSSRAADPTTDGIISCDRLIAKALYDLGYTDQPVGGITCGNADSYLAAWGFERSTDLAAARRGSIMLVKHTNKSYTSHMYVMASDFDESMRSARYDCGSNWNIQSQQPLLNVGFWYNPYDLIVYNIPA